MKITWGLHGDCVGIGRVIEANRRHRVGKRAQHDVIPFETLYGIDTWIAQNVNVDN